MADDDLADDAAEPTPPRCRGDGMLGGAMLAGLTGTAVGAAGGGFAGYAAATERTRRR